MQKLVTVLTSLFLTSTLFSASVAHASGLEAEDVWLRESVPGAENGAGFGVFHNHSEEDIAIVSASSNASTDVEIHRHVHQHGQMAMEQIDALTVPAGESVTLRPGGYHLMFMQLKQPLAVGDSYELTLRFDNGDSMLLTVPVKPLLQ